MKTRIEYLIFASFALLTITFFLLAGKTRKPINPIPEKILPLLITLFI